MFCDYGGALEALHALLPVLAAHRRTRFLCGGPRRCGLAIGDGSGKQTRGPWVMSSSLHLAHIEAHGNHIGTAQPTQVVERRHAVRRKSAARQLSNVFTRVLLTCARWQHGCARLHHILHTQLRQLSAIRIRPVGWSAWARESVIRLESII